MGSIDCSNAKRHRRVSQCEEEGEGALVVIVGRQDTSHQRCFASMVSSMWVRSLFEQVVDEMGSSERTRPMKSGMPLRIDHQVRIERLGRVGKETGRIFRVIGLGRFDGF